MFPYKFTKINIPISRLANYTIQLQLQLGHLITCTDIWSEIVQGRENESAVRDGERGREGIWTKTKKPSARRTDGRNNRAEQNHVAGVARIPHRTLRHYVLL